MPIQRCQKNNIQGCKENAGNPGKLKEENMPSDSENSMWELQDNNHLKFLVDVNQEVTLDENGIGKGYKVLYFKGKAQKFTHWMGEFELNTKIFQDMMVNHKKNAVGRDLSVNYNHERTVAAGWYKDLYLADKDGNKLSDAELTNLTNKESNCLLADIEWTPNAQKALQDKEYRYFSSEFVLGQYKNSETGKVYENVYVGGALTNNPFLRKTKVELDDQENQEETMKKKEIILA